MVMRMFKVNDYVTRKSYNNDTVFKIIDIVSNNYILKGIDMRLIADSPLDDLVLCTDYNDSFDLNDEVTKRFDRDDFFICLVKYCILMVIAIILIGVLSYMKSIMF